MVLGIVEYVLQVFCLLTTQVLKTFDRQCLWFVGGSDGGYHVYCGEGLVDDKIIGMLLFQNKKGIIGMLLIQITTITTT